MQKMAEKIMQMMSVVWLIAVFVLFAFYVENNYFNLLEAKAHICYMAALLFLSISSLALLAKLESMPIRASVQKFFHDFTWLDHSLLLFAVAAILSNLVTDHPSEALWGSYGWRVGTFWLVELILAYFFISRTVKVHKNVLYIIGVAAFAQFLLVMFNGFYLDLFYLHKGLSSTDYVRYVGTIGNTNWYVGYVVMLLPFFLMLGISRWGKISARIGLYFLTITTITCNSQGVFLGMGAVILAHLLLALKSKDTLSEAILRYTIMVLAIATVSVLRAFYPMVPLDGIGEALMDHRIWIGMLSLLIVIWLLLYKCTEQAYMKIKKPLVILILTLTVIAAGLVLYEQMKQFDDSWGTNRGRIWRVAVEAFTQMQLIQKIFGGGMNCFGFYYEAITGSNWVRNAHNEYLEFLVTTGVFGALCYLSIYGAIVYDYIKMLRQRAMDMTKDRLLIACILSVCGYAAQALVNNTQALNGAMLITILAVYRSLSKSY